jgi:hypothetical protein
MTMRWLYLPCCAALLAGCALGQKPQGAPLEPDSVGTILLRIPAENLGGAGAVDTRELAGKIAKNLAGWGYAISAEAADGHSHVMEARVGGIEKKGTPTGFSFSVGNSDPRALDFQRAEIVTVTCTLAAARQPREHAYLKEEFLADEVLKHGGRAKNDPALFKVYVDHIGTACFNLLTELKVKRDKPAPAASPGSPASESSWFPEVRIEVREKPVSPSPVAGPAPSATAPSPTAPDQAPAPAGAPPETPPVRTETQESEGRKQMIIHNQGHPIILEFGYERK